MPFCYVATASVYIALYYVVYKKIFCYKHKYWVEQAAEHKGSKSNLAFLWIRVLVW